MVDALADLIDDPLVRLVSLMDHTPGRRQWADVAKWRQLNGADISERGARCDPGAPDPVQGMWLPRRAAPWSRLCQDRGLSMASHDDASAEDVAEALEDGVTISEFPTTAAAARLAHARA